MTGAAGAHCVHAVLPDDRGLRVSLVVWATLLVADGAMRAVEPTAWRQHLVIAAAPGLGLLTTALRLRRMRARLTTPQESR